jgi:Tfp pilus assembly PilM family ATPase
MSWLDSLRASPAPPVAVEITPRTVSAAAIDIRGGDAVVTSHATAALPPGALVPSLTADNAHNRPAIVEAIRSVLDQTGRPRRIGLIVPDVVGKVSLLKFEQVPERTADLEQLIRWQARKTAPFAIDEAQVSFVPGFRADDGQEFIVSLARRSVIGEYESLCGEAGVYAGIVDLATLNIINAVLATRTAPAADWLLVSVTPDYASIAILRGEHVIFFRNRTEADGTLADVVHQSAMYYEDRLAGAGFVRVLVSGAAAAGSRHASDLDEVRRSLQGRVSVPVESFDPRAAARLTDRIGAAPALLDTLAPLIGLLRRGQG